MPACSACSVRRVARVRLELGAPGGGADRIAPAIQHLRPVSRAERRPGPRSTAGSRRSRASAPSPSVSLAHPASRPAPGSAATAPAMPARRNCRRVYGECDQVMDRRVVARVGDEVAVEVLRHRSSNWGAALGRRRLRTRSARQRRRREDRPRPLRRPDSVAHNAVQVGMGTERDAAWRSRPAESAMLSATRGPACHPAC